MDLLKKLLDLLTGGLGGTATGAVVGVAQFTAIAGIIGAGWLWIFENRDKCFAYCERGLLVSDLFNVMLGLAVIVGLLWFAGRGRPPG
jgi:hypothetical protein